MNIIDFARRHRWSLDRSSDGGWTAVKVPSTWNRDIAPQVTHGVRLEIDDEDESGLHGWRVLHYLNGDLIAFGLGPINNALAHCDEYV